MDQEGLGPQLLDQEGQEDQEGTGPQLLDQEDQEDQEGYWAPNNCGFTYLNLIVVMAPKCY